MILEVSAAGRLSGVGGVPIADNLMPSQSLQGLGKSTGSSLGVCVIKRIAPYLSLHRSFEKKTNENRTTRKDGVKRNIGATYCTKKVGYSQFTLYGASEELIRAELGHTWRSVGRCPCASIQRAVCTSFVRTDPWYLTS